MQRNAPNSVHTPSSLPLQSQLQVVIGQLQSSIHNVCALVQRALHIFAESTPTTT